ncbi:MAG: YciI family protein [Burkholderiales bacterium]
MDEPKVTRTDILKACEGMLCKQLYAVFTKPTNGLGPVMANIGPHLEHQVKLERDGIMFGAGPFWADNEEDWLGEGMVIIRASSLADAKRIAGEDPMHKSGARSFTVRPWLMNEGSITVKITYSDGKRELI